MRRFFKNGNTKWNRKKLVNFSTPLLSVNSAQVWEMKFVKMCLFFFFCQKTKIAGIHLDVVNLNVTPQQHF